MARRGGGGRGGGGGSGGKGGKGGGRRQWDDADEGEGIFGVGSGYRGKSKPRRGRRGEPEPDAGPPTASSRFPGYPPNRTLPQRTRDHILDGDPNNPNSGGHRHGTGRPDKTEFPQDWDDDKIIRNVQDVADNPDSATELDEGVWFVTGTRDGVKIGGFVGPDGVVRSGYPISGPGVRQNPPATP